MLSDELVEFLSLQSKKKFPNSIQFNSIAIIRIYVLKLSSRRTINFCFIFSNIYKKKKIKKELSLN